ncbi:hypothetical protein TCAL_10972 [Tigriopus californicus]|uniref:C2H2-type domain-containing protein n=1 Tax=Tigriopus californicus TaxID=6832 RepID=A0A553NF62_TIGCA|nr:early growth response protein 1-B-like [Tigriopus californicus]XP_059093568.1 early growth response protein 1-B-like [Tigriopus californicus]XP_059093569.1 early growth response protein 1-B-like [Tigriopus californicus]TRY64061.1 hypothetical protein TCAL_10972 [Tigriopus californicus]
MSHPIDNSIMASKSGRQSGALMESAISPEQSHPKSQLRKRKRLNAVLDKLTNNLRQNNSDTDDSGNNNVNMFNRTSEDSNSEKKVSPTNYSDLPSNFYKSSYSPRKLSNAALRREQWRDNQQQSVDDNGQPFCSLGSSTGRCLSNQPSGEVFKFDSFDKDRYGPGSCSSKDELGPTHIGSSYLGPNVNNPPPGEEVAEGELFSPISGRSPHSSLSSPQVSTESPRICFSPLRIKDSIEEEEDPNAGMVLNTLPKLSVRGCDSDDHCSSRAQVWTDQTSNLQPRHLFTSGFPTSLSGPISPNTPAMCTTPSSPSTTPLHNLKHLPLHITEAYRRRCLSDTDLSASLEDLPRSRRYRPSHIANDRVRGLAGPLPITTSSSATTGSSSTGVTNNSARYLTLPSKGDSLESEASSTTTQESPLDLSVRNSILGPLTPTRRSALMSGGSVDNIQNARGRGKSLTRGSRGLLRGTVSAERYPDRFSLDRLDISPVVEAVSGASNDVAYVCPICGQMFSLHDRLAKHMASRHKSRSTDSGTKAYGCDVCKRSFARSDMLTRHMRLHTGVKPYTCRVCGQVFSRSDHLSTHQRTHTGEKPYRCPSCPYAACRRDMITRHMRTHARYELQESTSVEEGNSIGDTDSPMSVGSGLITSRSVSSESADPPGSQRNKIGSSSSSTTNLPPQSPMETDPTCHDYFSKTGDL